MINENSYKNRTLLSSCKTEVKEVSIIIIILIIYKQWVLGLLTMCVVLVIDDPQNNCIVIHTIKIRIMIGAGINYKKWSLVCLTLSPSVNEPD